jgi:hypothetical protein
MFNTSAEFIAALNATGLENYSDPRPLKDRLIALSIKRKYPEGFKFHPARRKDGEPDHVAVIWIVYQHSSEANVPVDRIAIPIRLRAATVSQYLNDHSDYDYDDDNSPSELEVERSNSTPRPLAVEWPDRYAYDHGRDTLVDERGQPVSAETMLNAVFEAHCKSVHAIWGLPPRAAKAAKHKLADGFWLTSELLRRLLKSVFGRTLEDPDDLAGFLRGYSTSMMKKLEIDSLDLFGYKTAKSVIVLFCIICAVASIVSFLFGFKVQYVTHAVNSGFLSVIYGILGLWVLDVLVPHTILCLINRLIEWRTRLLLGVKR